MDSLDYITKMYYYPQEAYTVIIQRSFAVRDLADVKHASLIKCIWLANQRCKLHLASQQRQ